MPIGNQMGYALPPRLMQRATSNQEADSTQLHLKTQRPGTSRTIHVQVFGVDLSSNMDWKEHIDRTVEKRTVFWVFWEEISASIIARQNHLPMSHLFVHTWNIVPLFGILIQTNLSRNWRWFKEDQLGTAPIDTTTKVVSQICYMI